MKTVWICCRVDRPRGIEVAIALWNEEAPRFVQDLDELAGAELLLVLRTDADGRPRLELSEADRRSNQLSLFKVLQILWPSGGLPLRRRLEQAITEHNRVDLESTLQSLGEFLAARLDWWTEQPCTWREARTRAIADRAPLVLRLLRMAETRPKVEGADRSCGGAAPTTELEGAGRPVDQEAWRGWAERQSGEILDPKGGLARLLGDNFEFRPGQNDMALAVEHALEREEYLMVEAGTGIGKSVAYLVPFLLHGARHGERVVVSTYTKALQQQLIDNDLPLLTRLGYPGRARLLLGRSNYLCRRQLRRAMHHNPDSEAEACAQLALAIWARQSSAGQREELIEHPWFEQHWQRYFESVEPCSPHICHKDPICFVVQARRVAREAEIVVVNHSLLMMDLKSEQSLVGPASLLVVDEAHQLADVATRALSHWIAPERLEVYRNLSGDRLREGERREVLEHLVREALGLPGEAEIGTLASEVDGALDQVLGSFDRWFAAIEGQARERLGSHHSRAGAHRYHDGDEAFGQVREQSVPLLTALDLLDRSLAALLASTGELEETGARIDDEREGLASLLEFHREFANAIRFCLGASDEEWVYWFEWGGEKGLRAVVSAPLSVESPLAALWDRFHRTVVMTSATLAVESDFLPFAESVGFSRVARFTGSLQVSSPFHHDEQALVLTALDVPSPDDAEFPERVAHLVGRISTRVCTKTLVLSTSYRFIEQLEPFLAIRLQGAADDLFYQAGDGLTPELLVQRPGSARPQLADRFRRARAAILLATGSFWEGVDFPGRQLEVLVVPRLPFSVPTEPITEGRFDRARRLGRDPFQDVSLVEAVLRLKQGVGRLIRTREDRGVVLLLDQRLQTRSYGVSFLNSLPRVCELVPDLDEMAERVIHFLARERPPTS